MPPTRENALQGTPVIFVGTVRTIEAVHIVDGKVKRGRDRAGSLQNWQAFKFKVVEALKGVSSSSIIVNSGDEGCRVGFDIGQTYLVYADRYKHQPGFLTTTYCHRNSNIERAQDEVKWLRDLLKRAG